MKQTVMVQNVNVYVIRESWVKSGKRCMKIIFKKIKLKNIEKTTPETEQKPFSHTNLIC